MTNYVFLHFSFLEHWHFVYTKCKGCVEHLFRCENVKWHIEQNIRHL